MAFKEIERDHSPTTVTQRPKINWGVILGFLVSGISLYIAVRNLEPANVWAALQQAQYVWIVPAVILYLFALVMRTLRWKTLLSSERSVPFRHLLPTMAMGRGANNIYPFRTGEIVRVLLLRQRNEVSVPAGLASVLVERTFDGLTMILFLILAALIGGIPGYLRSVVGIAVGVFGGALALIYGMVLWPARIQRLVDGITEHLIPKRFRPQVRSIAGRFIHGFASIRSVWTATLALTFSVAVWTAETISYRLIMNSFGFGVSLHELLLMSSAANLGTALPSGPANLGTFDAPAIEVLTQVGIARFVATGYQAVLHAVLWSTETFAGLWFMWRSGLRKADLDRTLAERTAE